MGERIRRLCSMHGALRCSNSLNTHGGQQLLRSVRDRRCFWTIHWGELQPDQHHPRRADHTGKIHERLWPAAFGSGCC